MGKIFDLTTCTKMTIFVFLLEGNGHYVRWNGRLSYLSRRPPSLPCYGNQRSFLCKPVTSCFSVVGRDGHFKSDLCGGVIQNTISSKCTVAIHILCYRYFIEDGSSSGTIILKQDVSGDIIGPGWWLSRRRERNKFNLSDCGTPAPYNG